ncbi:methyl-accepting chemotaxis protein [Rhodocyclus tenuis]|uniref:HAMP domain-containing protein n=2 Tax=Rhodocyclus TaxID=1064 RepID=A0A6L5JWR2_RHOTE|nr:methyl-accepting chemotaxis protein [Rhodocyclus gracilis]MQY51471.1 HAMP domain-containing protein [Rhodocyclus gracilis]NJA89319.1 methyl-accepting chemotaxis protein [Rhodocyclus gracilis]
MNQLFGPAIAFLGRLRFAARFALIGVVTALLTGALLAQFLLQVGEKITVTEQEIDGTVTLVPLRQLALAIDQHLIASSLVALGDDSAKARADAAAQKIDTLFASPTPADAGLADGWKALGDEWQTLKKSLPNMTAPEIRAAHGLLLTHLSTQKRLVSDVSGLILDPEVDSYYLVATQINLMPQLAETLTNLRLKIASIAAVQMMDAADSTRIERLNSDATAQAARIRADLNKVTAAVPLHKESLETSMSAVDNALKEIRQLVDSRLIAGRAVSLDAETAWQNTQAATQALDELDEAISRSLAERLDLRAQALIQQRLLNIAMVIVGILLATYLVGGFYFSLQRGASTLIEGGRRLADGDLGHVIDVGSRDEHADIAESFNRMAASIRDVVGSLRQSAVSVLESARTLASATQSVAELSAQQSTLTQSTASSAEHLAQSVEQVQASAGQLDGMARDSQRQAEEGNAGLRRMLEEIKVVSEAVGQIGATVDEFVHTTLAITSMTGQVREIAEQTNLLALNAAIEAARAGESGRGFAVVADEVRKLAEKSAQSANEIDRLTQALNGRSEGVTSAIQRGHDALAASEGYLQTVAGQLAGASGSAATTSQGVEEITQAVDAQTRTIQEIHAFVSRIAEMAAHNDRSVTEAAEQAVQLETLSNELQGAIGRFRQ